MWMDMRKTTPRGSKKCLSSCPLIRINTKGSGTTQRIAPYWAQTTTPKPQLMHTTYCIVTRNRHHHAKCTRNQKQLPSYKLVIQRKKDSTRKQWEIISVIHMQLISGNSTLFWKFPIINIQHPHWITITTCGNHEKPNHKGCINHRHH